MPERDSSDPVSRVHKMSFPLHYETTALEVAMVADVGARAVAGYCLDGSQGIERWEH